MLVILDGYRNKYIAHIIVDSLRMEKLKAEIGSFREVEGCFIVKVNRVLSVSPSFKVDYDPGQPSDQNGDGGEEPYITIGDMGTNKITIFKGTLLDYSIISN